MNHLKVTELKKHLKEYDQKELIQLIADLYKMNKEVKSYLSLRFLDEEATEEFFLETKQKIKHEFFPEKGDGKLRLKEAKKAISDFKKYTGDELRTADLLLYYVEQGVEFTNTFGDIYESFYTSIENTYEKITILCLEKEEYYKAFKDRLKQIVIDTDGIGWGFHDHLSHLYYEMEDNVFH